ncbi:DUF4835 family protein [Dysgonomonas sp. 25]|uniref:type IX secretion system protein PorD n=1 Tax=Dysgonomonas sp. 25 TaxID=2302933 RepID=UPI0013CFBFF9|nr:DUF4835 family protein [Dysgonomonas sp. 25]NDV67620.1 DUF4835 family protein [Dysgonomonas sp. 25]
MMRIVALIISLLLAFGAVQAQELVAKVTLNTQKVQLSNQDIAKSLEEGINHILNDTKWTNTTFNKSERIDCSVAISLNEVTSSNTFSAEIVITSRRPVYNSGYLTTLLNFRDTQFKFDYTYGQSLDYNTMSVDNNLVAVIAYYANLVIGLDFDSFQLNGGKPYFAKALEIANTAQGFGTVGWEPFSNKNNRYDVANALTDDAMAEFHAIWYKYHRQGLDEMAANPTRGRITIIETLNTLKELHTKRPSSPIFSLFAEAKVAEIIRVCSACTPDEKKEIKKLLISMFPTKSREINELN